MNRLCHLQILWVKSGHLVHDMLFNDLYFLCCCQVFWLLRVRWVSLPLGSGIHRYGKYGEGKSLNT
jgi:hypothetical protein